MKPVHISLLCAAFALSACSSESTNTMSSNNALVMPPAEVTAVPEDQDALAANDMPEKTVADGWTGKWNGPEGLFLDIAPDTGPGRYRLTINDNLDTQAQYQATATPDGLTFQRNGVTEQIRAGNGDATGFKYLFGKKDCLIVQPGKEGYCRD